MSTPGAIRLIPLADLHESPFNPRRTMSDTGLQELDAKPEALLATAKRYGVSLDPNAPEAPIPLVPAARASVSAKAVAKGVKYFDPATESTWSGRGLMPAWLRAAIAKGKTLADFELTKAGSAGTEQTDDAGVAAGGSVAEAVA